MAYTERLLAQMRVAIQAPRLHARVYGIGGDTDDYKVDEFMRNPKPKQVWAPPTGKTSRQQQYQQRQLQQLRDAVAAEKQRLSQGPVRPATSALQDMHDLQSRLNQITLNQITKQAIFPRLIQDIFFQATPLLRYLQDKQGNYSYTVEDEAEVLQLHEPGYLCHDNPYCAECYS